MERHIIQNSYLFDAYSNLRADTNENQNQDHPIINPVALEKTRITGMEVHTS